MSAEPLVIDDWFYEGQSPVLLARVVDIDGQPAEIADFTGAAYTVYDFATMEELASGSLAPADVLFDALQTDARWNADKIGYNFRWLAPAETFPLEGEAYYWVEVVLTRGGNHAPLIFKLYQYPLQSR